MIPPGKCWMMSLTSSVTPPKLIETVESGCDPAGADAGLAEKESIVRAAGAEAGAQRMSKMTATVTPAARVAPKCESLRITLPIDHASPGLESRAAPGLDRAVQTPTGVNPLLP
jgi:hypothetical protein